MDTQAWQTTKEGDPQNSKTPLATYKQGNASHPQRRLTLTRSEWMHVFHVVGYTRVTKVLATDVGLGLTLDRHYTDVGGRRRPRPTLLRHFIRHRRPMLADADIAPTQR